MKKSTLPFIAAACLLFSCGNQPTPSSSSKSSEASSSEPTSSSQSSSSRSIGVPRFSKDKYSYDKNALCDLEMPVELNGVNIYACYFEDYLLTAKQAKYEESKKVLSIKESFMAELEKGEYTLTVYYDEEISPSLLSVEVMNSVKTSFDTTTKKFTFGKTGDLEYDCDFSSAHIVSLKKGEIEIPSTYYEYADSKLTIDKEVFEHCYGTSKFTLSLSNHDSYSFDVVSDVMFFTDYDLTTIHSTIESVYGANPLYQYASSDSVMIVDASEFGMSGNALKYIPNNVEVELDCNAIMTLGDAYTSMSWYKVGYVREKSYAISFDYQTIGSSDKAGQTFCFASTTTWGAPFVINQPLLMGTANDNKVHHFSAIFSGEEIQSGTFIYAKWLGGSGYLLLDNFRVSEVVDGLEIVDLPIYQAESGDYVGSVNAHGWKYEIYVDNELIPSAICEDTSFTIPSAAMNEIEVGTHEISFRTLLGDVKGSLTIRQNGSASLAETTKSFTGEETSIKLAGTFVNCSITKVTKFGSNQYDVSVKNGKEIDKANWSIVSDGLVIAQKALKTLYGTTTVKVDCSTGDQLTITLINTKQIFLTDFNETDVWCWDNISSSMNISITQDTKMTSLGEVEGKRALVYEPAKAEQTHAKNPTVCQNGIFTFRSSKNAPVAWEDLPFDLNTTYKFSLDYKIEGDNATTKFIFYRWLATGAEDKANELDPNATTWSYSCKAGDFYGFHFCCAHSTNTDTTGYKVTITRFSVEAVL